MPFTSSPELNGPRHSMAASPPVSAPSPAPELPAPRAFGAAPADLDLEFGGPDRAALVTALLAQCCVENGFAALGREDAAWSLPLSARIARLLRIVELTSGDASLGVALHCPQPDCRQPCEIELPFAALAAEASETTASPKIVQFPRENAAPLALRLPTGRDQAAWRDRRFADHAAALAAIVQSLAVEPAAVESLAPEQIAPLAAAMEAADPLVAFSVNTTCPHCARPADIPVDLEAVALQQLARHRRGVLRDVHALAAGYGWSEAQVLAIPPSRRAEYKALLGSEGGASA